MIVLCWPPPWVPWARGFQPRPPGACSAGVDADLRQEVIGLGQERSLPAAQSWHGGALAGKTFTQITTGSDHTCAIGATGAACCWGDNAAGDLGDGTTTQWNVPVLIGPSAPVNVTAKPGRAAASVSWPAPPRLDGGILTGYTATASPGGKECSTACETTCRITGLASRTTYSVTVIAHTTIGDSRPSAPATVTPGSGRRAFTR
jgi:hypothetical protein